MVSKRKTRKEGVIQRRLRSSASNNGAEPLPCVPFPIQVIQPAQKQGAFDSLAKVSFSVKKRILLDCRFRCLLICRSLHRINMSIAYLRNHIVAPFIRLAPVALFSTCALLLAPIRTISGTTLPDGFGEIQYAHNLLSPTAMAFAPDPCPGSGPVVHRLFVCEQGGRVRVFRNGVLQPNAFLNVIADTRTERGLDGICFDPNFATNHYVYICYTVKQADPTLPTHNRVSRFTANPANPDVALAGSEKRILDLVNVDNFIHNGSALHFGPDG